MRHITVGGRPAGGGGSAAPSNEEGPSFPLTERHDWAEDTVVAADIKARAFLPNRLSFAHCFYLLQKFLILIITELGIPEFLTT